MGGALNAEEFSLTSKGSSLEKDHQPLSKGISLGKKKTFKLAKRIVVCTAWHNPRKGLFREVMSCCRTKTENTHGYTKDLFPFLKGEEKAAECLPWKRIRRTPEREGFLHSQREESS